MGGSDLTTRLGIIATLVALVALVAWIATAA